MSISPTMHEGLPNVAKKEFCAPWIKVFARGRENAFHSSKILKRDPAGQPINQYRVGRYKIAGQNILEKHAWPKFGAISRVYILKYIAYDADC